MSQPQTRQLGKEEREEEGIRRLECTQGARQGPGQEQCAQERAPQVGAASVGDSVFKKAPRSLQQIVRRPSTGLTFPIDQPESGENVILFIGRLKLNSF